MPKYFLCQVMDTTIVKVQVSQGSVILGAILEISIPNTPSSWSSFCIQVLWLGTFRKDVIFLPEELSISC